MSSIKAQAVQRVQELINLANEKYNLAIPQPDVSFNVTGYRVAGYARRVGPMYFVNLNAEACEKYPEEMLNETIPHEVAHIVCFFNPALGKNHDGGWKRVCRALGGTGSRTHSMQLTPAKTIRKWLYRDSCGTVREVTTTRHNKMRKLGAMYRYRDNGGIINASCLIQTNPTQEVKTMNTQQVVQEQTETQVEVEVETQVEVESQVETQVEAEAETQTEAEVPVTKGVRTQARYRKASGRPSKAELTRQVIAEMRDASKSDIFTAIQERVGFTRAMARHYYYANLKIMDQQVAQ